MKTTLHVLKELGHSGVMSRHAIGGAIAATFYTEPVLTFDLDIFLSPPEFASFRDLRLPGHHLEKLRGDRVGQHSIRINDKWRICFQWKDGDAYDVEIVDYH